MPPVSKSVTLMFEPANGAARSGLDRAQLTRRRGDRVGDRDAGDREARHAEVDELEAETAAEPEPQRAAEPDAFDQRAVGGRDVDRDARCQGPRRRGGRSAAW
jgi:hypothetical protein